MRHANDFDDCCCLGNRLNNSVRSDSNAIGVFGAAELLTPSGKGFNDNLPTALTILGTISFGRFLSSLIADFFHSML